jgi:hypothetical protein
VDVLERDEMLEHETNNFIFLCSEFEEPIKIYIDKIQFESLKQTLDKFSGNFVVSSSNISIQNYIADCTTLGSRGPRNNLNTRL